MDIASLNKRIEVLEQVERKNSFGEVVGEWLTMGRVWASVQPQQGNEAIEDNQLKYTQKTRFYMRFYAGLTPKHRIRFDGKLYNILSVSNTDSNLRDTVVIAKEIESG